MIQDFARIGVFLRIIKTPTNSDISWYRLENIHKGKNYMSKKIIIKLTRLLCKITHNDFLIVLDGVSYWSVSNNKHIRDVAYYHKRTEV